MHAQFLTNKEVAELGFTDPFPNHYALGRWGSLCPKPMGCQWFPPIFGFTQCPMLWVIVWCTSIQEHSACPGLGRSFGKQLLETGRDALAGGFRVVRSPTYSAFGGVHGRIVSVPQQGPELRGKLMITILYTVFSSYCPGLPFSSEISSTRFRLHTQHLSWCCPRCG